ncbi:hypothetical protein D3C75_1075820 [compost metagenome]
MLYVPAAAPAVVATFKSSLLLTASVLLNRLASFNAVLANWNFSMALFSEPYAVNLEL